MYKPIEHLTYLYYVQLLQIKGSYALHSHSIQPGSFRPEHLYNLIHPQGPSSCIHA